MSKIHLGTGSEWHMLRMLGRHRDWFTRRVYKVIGEPKIEWLDFDFTEKLSKNYGDAESKALDFLPEEDCPARMDWTEWWPQTGNVHNWDAVGRRKIDGDDEWLLVEAKGNIQELKQSTGAKPASKGGGRDLIVKRLAETQRAMGLTGDLDWTTPHYQFANRLAILHFLTEQKIPARLLFVYFTGDDPKGGNRRCPGSESEWRPELEAMKRKLGITGKSDLERRVHEIFVPVTGG